MKSFLRFILLFIIPLFVIAISSILISNSIEDFKNSKVVIYCIFFFATLSFAQVYIFKRCFATKTVFFKLKISSLTVFTIVFLFGMFFPAFQLTSRNLAISLFQAALGVCIFFLEYLIINFYDKFDKKNKLLFTDKLVIYLKIIFIVSLFEAILFCIMTVDILIESAQSNNLFSYLTPIIIIHFLINYTAFISLKYLSNLEVLKYKSVLIIVLSTLISFFVVNLFNFIRLKYVFHSYLLFLILCIFSSLLLFTIVKYRDELNSSKNNVKLLTKDIIRKNAEYLQLKQQVNPHFLFNNLNTLISFIEINPKKAIEFGHHLSNTYRHYLINENEDVVLLSEELFFINEYLEIYKAKFENNFTFEIDVLENENFYILPLTLQELIDNIFKHNRYDLQSPLRISISTKDDFLEIRNSINLFKPFESNKSGLENIKKRYEFYSSIPVEIVTGTDFFIVRLPILKLQK